MRPQGVRLTGVERRFQEDELIVSKTDLKGVITYANAVSCRVSGYTEQELVGQPHNIVRHPAMPRCVFQLMWDIIQSGQEMFGYVLNLAKNGDHYWVFAHITPTLDGRGNMLGYHSNRRVPEPRAVARVQEIYGTLLAEERKIAGWREGMAASGELLSKLLGKTGTKYEEWVFSI
jgi:PAS domain S-box-containing protein